MSETLKELEINSSSYKNLQEICKNKVLLVIDFTAVWQALSKSGLKTFGGLELCQLHFVHQWFKESNFIVLVPDR